MSKDFALQPKAHLPGRPDWDAIRRAYDAQELTVNGLCRVHGVSERRLYRKWEEEGWPLRHPFRARHIAVGQEALSARLVGALDKKMRQFEMRLKRGRGEDSAADSERDARTLNMLVRLFEKLAALQGAEAGQPASRARRSSAPDVKAAKDSHDQERLRGELACRLDNLKGQIGG